MKPLENNDHHTLSGYERFDQLCQKREHKERSNEPIIVPAVIKLIAWISLVAGALCTIFGLKDGTWIYGLEAIAASVFLFGFSAIVKAAYKYLDE